MATFIGQQRDSSAYSDFDYCDDCYSKNVPKNDTKTEILISVPLLLSHIIYCIKIALGAQNALYCDIVSCTSCTYDFF